MINGEQAVINDQHDEPEIEDGKTKGLILHLQRFSIDDGPGIRTTVFFKGCPLQCQWCQNPESILNKPQVQWLENRCIGCRTCIDACNDGCLTMREKVIMIDRHCCAGCGTCARACPAGAMDLLGTHISVDELFKEVIKDRAFFEKSGGGVTVSGGEPTMQPDFIASLFHSMNKAGINTALDTCGLCSVEKLKKILPHTDIVLYDLKEIDPDKHYKFTGQDNQRIFDNLLFIRDHIMEMKTRTRTKLWIRTPLIPGTTATCENLTGIGTFLAQNLADTIQRWELCAFNNLCRDKYRRLGIEWPFSDTPLITQRTLHELEACAKRSGINPNIVLATGATRMELNHGEDRL